MDNYFDLHLHPSFKPYLSHYVSDQRRNCWDFLSSLVPIVRSQGCLGMMKEARVNLAVAAIYAMERPMTASFMIEHIAPKLTLLHGKVLDHPAYANYFNVIHEEIQHLKRSSALDPDNGRHCSILSSMDEIKEDEMNLILAIEGGHALEMFGTHPIDNLKRLKEGPYRFLYLTLVHMTQYPIATHCYGIKLIKNNDQFKPRGFGLRPLAKDIIDVAYDKSIGDHRIFIDIKHLSLVSRRQFYDYRKEKGYDDIPIMATHMGVTGISWAHTEIANYFSERVIRKDGYIEVNYDRPVGIGRARTGKTHFNPWSINLYDEEIPEILDSGGLIGINMDQRILGSQAVQGEFFSEQEFAYIISGYKDSALPKETWDEIAIEGEFVEEEEDVRAINERKHLRHLCNQILHIIKIGGERAWQQICIGSDFDGLINPINNCKNVSEYPKLEQDLLRMLPQMMEESRHDYDSSDMATKVRGFMYDNAVRFLGKHFR